MGGDVARMFNAVSAGEAQAQIYETLLGRSQLQVSEVDFIWRPRALITSFAIYYEMR